ncbi:MULTISPECIES: helix-turn-helix domain-containing protein [Morganellaceae]|uniref:helix-turn-helix domain-containing protein n=1 Tax=Morganellaceae TaxID=1903414 RepID=UPI001E30A39C|nr:MULTISPECIES: helix-turn-helix transcriptional regulator [Morganellaceae]MCK3668314.1 helix-turn-helix domain-containing protein [Photorhabdus noenieputensis]MDC9607196.1 helix-turn-helix transcriptional regulator [Xenorhabdus griffiniae]
MLALFPWRVISMDFGKRLVTLRKDRKLTQAALAEKVGCHVTMIRRYEADEVQPTLEIIRKLSRALSVSADTLVFDENERNPDEELRLQFEAISQFTPEEKEVARVLLESLILKHDANRFARNNSRAGTEK